MQSCAMTAILRVTSSMLIGALPAYAIFEALRLLARWYGLDLVGGADDTLLKMHFPQLFTLDNWITQHSAWALWLLTWAVCALLVYKAWSKRIVPSWYPNVG